LKYTTLLENYRWIKASTIIQRKWRQINEKIMQERIEKRNDEAARKIIAHWKTYKSKRGPSRS